MAIKRINSIYFLVDSVTDIPDLPAKMGNKCFVIDESCEYQCDSNGEWHKQTAPVTGPGSHCVWQELEEAK